MFELVEVEKANYPVTVLCRTLGMSTAGFYGWRHAQAHPCQRRRDDVELVERIREIHRTSRRSYGSPRVHDELRLGEGRRVSRKRIERLMRVNGIVGIHASEQHSRLLAKATAAIARLLDVSEEASYSTLRTSTTTSASRSAMTTTVASSPSCGT